MSHSSQLLATLLILLGPSLARAEAQRTVAGSRVLLGDLIAEVPEPARNFDLGPTPAPGSSRLISSADIKAAAREAGLSVTSHEPVRVFPATKRWEQPELREVLKAKLQSALPAYARLLDFVAPRRLVTRSNAELSRVVVAALPAREGLIETSFVVEVATDGHIEQRLVIPVSLEVRDAPKPIELARGTLVNFVIRAGSAQISTAAVILQPTKLGATTLIRVLKTRKTLRARLLTPTSAELFEQ
jgi:hypothetical protein